jgi:aryl-alcohol dehydrogenase-like predicted oxidoreductase
VLQTRKLGRDGPEVGAIGLGCAPMSGLYGEASEEEGLRAIHAALDLGMNLLDTADVYGAGHNERLVGKAIRDRRDEVVLATKFGNILDGNGRPVRISGRAEYVHEACDASLRRLGVDTIDLYLQHRVDPDTPIEETVGAVAELIEAGKVRYIGLCEALPADLRRAAGVHPIAALQSEYSLLERGVEAEVLDTCQELGIGFVAYSPLSRGILGGAVTVSADDDPADTRSGGSRYPRFGAAHLPANMELAQTVRRIAAEHGAEPAEVALAWLLARPHAVVPIPGTRREAHVLSNARAAALTLDRDDDDELEQLASRVSGERFGGELPMPDWLSPAHRSS